MTVPSTASWKPFTAPEAKPGPRPLTTWRQARTSEQGSPSQQYKHPQIYVRPTVIPTWYLHMMPLHISGGIPEQTVRNEAMGIHAINEWKCGLQGWKGGVRLAPAPAFHPLGHPAQSLTMPVSDVKMTISYRGASCWNKVSMPGRFLNLQPVASCRGSKDRAALRAESPKGQDPA